MEINSTICIVEAHFSSLKINAEYPLAICFCDVIREVRKCQYFELKLTHGMHHECFEQTLLYLYPTSIYKVHNPLHDLHLPF